MLSIFVVQLPFTVCMVWFLLSLFKGHKGYSKRLFTIVMALLSLCFLCGSNFLSYNPNFRRQVVLNVIMTFSTLSVPPLICFYLRSLMDQSYIRNAFLLALLPALLLCGANIYLTSLLGMNHCADLIESLFINTVTFDSLDVLERTYVVITYLSYRIVFFILLGSAFIYFFLVLNWGRSRLGHIFPFIRGRKASFTANIMAGLFIIYFILWAMCVIFEDKFMDIFSAWSLVWAIFTSLLLFFIGYIGFIPSLPDGYMTMDKLRHPFTSAPGSLGENEDSAAQLVQPDYLSTINSGPLAVAAASRTGQPAIAAVALSGYDKIMDSFNDLMINHQAFLNPQITIDEIAVQLNSNRTYVSKLVNVCHGMPFRDYLNKLRIDYSKQLMLDEPDATIDYISAKSGFQSSTQFIRKFRELEGSTPSLWRSQQ